MLVGGGRMQLSPQVAASVSFCFSPEGVPFTIRDVEDAARNIFPGHVGPLEGLTTYSFRRILPTVGHMLQFSSGLGDWLDKDTTKGCNAPPLLGGKEPAKLEGQAQGLRSGFEVG